MAIRKPASGSWFLVWLGLFPILTLNGPAATPPASEAKQHWAFQPRSTPAPPQLDQDAWSRTGVDRFILARLQAADLSPAPPADPATLVRRMSFDLTGLPPSPEALNTFVELAARDRDGAIEQLINRLLDSPHYGERWGRHWLDVARYSDTKGYVYAREERRFVHAHAYRDWVIQAFNEDLPYNRFLLLQLAADQVVPSGSPDLAAMGFITGGRRFIGVTQDIIDDRIDVVTRGTMALTVQCARCHDHKYDPIPTADYYSLYGVFHGSDDRLVLLDAAEDAELQKHQDDFRKRMKQRRKEAAQRLRDRIADYLAAQTELEKYPEQGFDQILADSELIPASVRRWRDYLHRQAQPDHPIFGPWAVLGALPPDRFEAEAGTALKIALTRESLNPILARTLANPGHLKSLKDLAALYGQAFKDAANDPNAPGAKALTEFLHDSHSPTTVPDTGIINNERYFPTGIIEELWKMQGNVDRRLIQLGSPAALILVDGPPEPNPRIRVRGQAGNLGDEVPRQFLGLFGDRERQPFRKGSGRLEMAQAILRPDNPLTARVMVNRIWQHHFQEGLVRTPSDFGTRADPPSHPQLLDWLANRFITENWSIKSLHRLILSSAVYQQASISDRDSSRDRARTVDPDNRLLSHYPIRRLSFEELRDAMLFASGELDLTMGGKPVGLTDSGNRRRTIYAEVDRQFLPGVLRTFDFANPDIHVPVRSQTTVPQQALFFLNGPFAADRARALIRKVADLPSRQRVQALNLEITQRPATERDVEQALAFIESSRAMSPEEKKPAPSPWQYGTGEYDTTNGGIKSFTPLPHFTGSAWQGARDWPGGVTGWAQLTAQGGHPGNTLRHACVRRWVAPVSASITIRGELIHEPEPGDGIRGFITSSRHGELKAVAIHQTTADMSVSEIQVEAGDTIDFIVDIGKGLHSDQFLWEPVIHSSQSRWEAASQFSGPEPTAGFLTPWEQYAQVLLLANAFAFVD